MVELITEDSMLKYTHPKIMLIDCENTIYSTLINEGFNVSEGSFGNPYNSKPTGTLHKIVANGHLPKYFIDQQIVIIDLTKPNIISVDNSKVNIIPGESDWFIRCLDDSVDPRPVYMFSISFALEKIRIHGGVFIIFADKLLDQEIYYGKPQQYEGIASDINLKGMQWCFLRCLDSLPAYHPIGKEYSFVEGSNPINTVFKRKDLPGEYRCIIDTSSIGENWTTLGVNKYNEVVAGYIQEYHADTEKTSYVFILPQLVDKAGFLQQFIRDDLPNIVPSLFPDFETLSWVYRSEYEIGKVLEYQNQISDTENELTNRISDLINRIGNEREDNRYLYTLLTGTGTELVNATITALTILGFCDVRDLDNQKDVTGDSQNREDLWLMEQDKPLLLVEVKGLGGLPQEEDLLAVSKYIAPRMRILQRLDIQGLTIINYQRHIPPLERDDDVAFQKDVITTVENTKIGLMTTFMLYKLVRSYLHNNWQKSNIIPIFYNHGRINPLPTNYEFAGIIDHYYGKAQAVTIKLTGAALQVNDRISFDAGTIFEEQVVESLQIDKTPCSTASIGVLVGVKTLLPKDKLREGTKVYLVKSE